MDCDDGYTPSSYCSDAVSAVGGDAYVCPFLFDFLTVKEVGRAATVCTTWQEGAADDELWRTIYERTQVGEADVEEWVRALSARPYGEDAIGWHVEVWQEEEEEWLPGVVSDYADGLYEVEYPSGLRQREHEHRTQGPWHRTGNSRIVFTSGLNDDSMVDSGGGAGTGDAGSTGNTPPATAGGSQKEDGAGRARGGGSSSFSSSAAQWSRVRHGCWKEELKANACNVPRVRLNELNEHRDQVLDIRFSPDGTRLASCSRDMSVLIYAIEDEDHGKEENEGRDDGEDRQDAGRGDEMHDAGGKVAGINRSEGGVRIGGNDGDKVGEVAAPGVTPPLPEEGRPLNYGGLSIRLLHRLTTSVTASVCRMIWSPCSKFLLCCLEEPSGDPFSASSSELFDVTTGQRLSRCISRPFDVHASWLPDGKHLVTGIEVARDQSDDAESFSQTLAIRRRPNLHLTLPGARSGTAMPGRIEGRDVDPATMSMDNDINDIHGGGHLHVDANVTEQLAVGAADARVTNEDYGSFSATVSAGVSGVSGISEGVGWGEESLSFPVAWPSSSLPSLLPPTPVVGGDRGPDEGIPQTGACGGSTGVRGSVEASSSSGAAGGESASGAEGLLTAEFLAATAAVSVTGGLEEDKREEVDGVIWVDAGLEGKGPPRKRLAMGADRHSISNESFGKGNYGLSGVRDTAADAARAVAMAVHSGKARADEPDDDSHAGKSSGEGVREDSDKTGGDGWSFGSGHVEDMWIPVAGVDTVGAASTGAAVGSSGDGEYGNGYADGDGGGYSNDNGNGVGIGISDSNGNGNGNGNADEDEDMAGGPLDYGFGGGVAPAVGGAYGGGHDGVDLGAGEQGGVEWVIQGSEGIATVEEADMALVGEIRLKLGKNFGRFFQISRSGSWACIATGTTWAMCHRVVFIPLTTTKAETAAGASASADAAGHVEEKGCEPSTSSSGDDWNMSEQAGRVSPPSGRHAPVGIAGPEAAAPSEVLYRGVDRYDDDDHDVDDNMEDRIAAEATAEDHDVCVRFVNEDCCAQGSGGSVGEDRFFGDGRQTTHTRMEAIECGGAVLSVCLSHDDKFLMINVRPFTRATPDNMDSPQWARHVPDISNDVRLQIWDVETKKMLFSLGGHHAFTTKYCPFVLFSAQSSADRFGDYACSGSEEYNAYVWHLRHRILLSTLKGHSDVVNSVSWNSKYSGLMASCGDDGLVVLWGPKVRP